MQKPEEFGDGRWINGAIIAEILNHLWPSVECALAVHNAIDNDLGHVNPCALVLWRVPGSSFDCLAGRGEGSKSRFAPHRGARACEQQAAVTLSL